MNFPRRTLIVAASALLLASALVGCGGGHASGDWPLPNLDLASTRTLSSSGIGLSNIGQLHVAWRFRFPGRAGDSGAFTATPIVVGGVVYLQDARSNVFALDLTTGKVLWRRLFDAASPGPNGIAVVAGRVYGATDSSAFALDAATGRPLWRHFLVTAAARYVDIAPQVADGLVFVSTIGLPPNGRGALYALDAADRKGPLGALDDQDSVARPGRGRRWRSLGDTERFGSRGLLGHDEPVSLRRHSGTPERGRLRGRRSLHRQLAGRGYEDGQARLVRPGDAARRA